MKWNFLDPEQRLLWMRYAKDHLKRELKARPCEYTTRKGKKVTIDKLNDVYKYVLEVGASVGKNMGQRTPPNLTDIQKLQKTFPDLHQAVNELHELNTSSTQGLRAQRDQLVRELREELRVLREKTNKLEKENERQKEIIRLLNDVEDN